MYFILICTYIYTSIKRTITVTIVILEHDSPGLPNYSRTLGCSLIKNARSRPVYDTH